MSIMIPAVRNKFGATTADVIAEQIALCNANIANISRIAKYRRDREIRDEINRRLRGCHDFLGMAGSRKNGCLYREVGSQKSEALVCEHAIPVTGLVSLYLAGAPFEDLVFYPVARISKASDRVFERLGLVKSGFDPINIFLRYATAGVRIETHEGVEIDTGTWTIQDHWELIYATPIISEIRDQVHALLEKQGSIEIV